MARLGLDEKLELMEMVSDVAAEAAGNPNITGDMVSFQTELVEALYRTMERLVLEGEDEDDDDEEEDDEDDYEDD